MRISERLAFAADRKPVLDRAESQVADAVKRGLDRWPARGWTLPIIDAATTLYRDTFRDEHGGPDHPNLDEQISGYRTALIRNLAKVDSEPTDTTQAAVTRMVATSAVNAATTFAATVEEKDMVLEWVTMHDDKVRETHAEVDGQRVPAGQEFTVGGQQMPYPGFPVGDPALWINCRCLARPDLVGNAALLAAADGGKPCVVVALPAADDPVNQVSSEPAAHATLLYLGIDPAPDQLSAAQGELGTAAQRLAPFADPVNGRGTLGADQADVVMLDAQHLAEVRAALLAQPALAGLHQAAEQFPTWIPHVTLGYPQAPATGDPPGQIGFDRLALWNGAEQTEYPLEATMPTAAAAETEQQQPPITVPDPIPWHGVLAPEGVASGDKRRFAAGALRNRDLPLPLTWQPATADRHGGAITVAQIENIARDGDLIKADGHFLQSVPEADQVIGMCAEMGKMGVSVDLDDATFDLDEETGQVTFSDARISSASIVAIPAFTEAFIALGSWADSAAMVAAGCPCDGPEFATIDEKPWSNYSESDYSPQQWHDACLIHLHSGDPTNKADCKLPVRTPAGTINRAGVHAAASALAGGRGGVDAPASEKSSAKAALRGLYKQLGETPPDSIAMSAEEAEAEAFDRGPGWVTDPKATKRIHDYWMPGHPGGDKIGWGRGGDFNRCREQVGEEIGESSPAKLRFINQICAQWHHDALGFWPSTHRKMIREGVSSSAVSLTASAAWTYPAEFFGNPQLDVYTPMTITDDDRIFGHLCKWDSCHVAFPKMCVSPPHSASGYAYFLLGLAPTDAGGYLPSGVVSLGGGHANGDLGFRAALAHYDNVATAVADITVGEDDIGIWYSGGMRPTTTAEQRQELLASKLSGDWREIGGDWELMAAAAVNVPGFPNPRIGVVNGRQVSLVAAGIPAEPPTVDMLVSLAIQALDRRARMRELAAATHTTAADRMAALAGRLA
jgi:hypothetical protein